MTTLSQPWTSQCPIDLAKLLNLLGSVETYLRPRAISPQQRTMVGQIAYIRHNLQNFSGEPLPSRRPSGKHRKLVRQRVLERDNHQCVSCGATTDLEIHHIIPLSSGGTNHISNLQTLCYPCHQVCHS